jgi:hypothetical protein
MARIASVTFGIRTTQIMHFYTLRFKAAQFTTGDLAEKPMEAGVKR